MHTLPTDLKKTLVVKKRSLATIYGFEKPIDIREPEWYNILTSIGVTWTRENQP